MTPEELLKDESQDIFDDMVAHLRLQNKRAVVELDNGLIRCQYRLPDGLKCAVGCLIPDTDYDKIMEHKELHTVLQMLNKPLSDKLLRHEELLCRMQRIHDDEHVEDWETRFAQLAHDLGLLFVNKNTKEKEPANDLPTTTTG
jgi:hypothetical protein